LEINILNSDPSKLQTPIFTMPTPIFTPATLKFLKQLKKNNNRDWFNKNKNRYEEAREELKNLQAALLNEMSHQDEIARVKLFRIYRDVRFSKNKDPYKPHFSGYIERATKWRRGGYYFQISPNGNSMAGGGFFSPEKDDLKRIRKEIEANDKPFRKIINAKVFKDTFKQLNGEQLKTAPRGFDKEHPAVDLLRYKQFYVSKQFSDEEILDGNFVKELCKVYKKMRPFFNYMSEVLTTDENGVPIE